MTRKTYTLELITPCFCSGANAAQAEIRAPSIRGQLRWWFRALGGSAVEEAEVFGSAAGDDGFGSSLRIAIADFKRGPQWTLPKLDQSSAQNYIWHFASVSGKSANAGRNTLGPRWQTNGALPPGSIFKLHITQLRPIKPELLKKLDFAVDAFLCFGSLGLRATRGLGAFHCIEARPWGELLEPLSRAGFTTALRQDPDVFSGWESALRDWSAWLRYQFRDPKNGGVKAKDYSALGGIDSRQASAVRFRPIKIGENKFTWLALEAPHERVLGKKTSKILTPTSLTGPAPTAPPRAR
jgi:CRISPR type III-B/RAMP module RAMP protein Cmr1